MSWAAHPQPHDSHTRLPSSACPSGFGHGRVAAVHVWSDERLNLRYVVEPTHQPTGLGPVNFAALLSGGQLGRDVREHSAAFGGRTTQPVCAPVNQNT